MFSSVPRRCVSVQANWAEVKRGISKTVTVTHSDALTLNQQKENKKNDAKDTSKKLLQLKKYHRLLSNLNSSSMPLATRGSTSGEEETNDFVTIFPDILEDLTNTGRRFDIPDATEWFSKVLQYNVPLGKKNRGLAVVSSYKMMADPKELTPENLRLAMILGWCVEMLQASLLVTDDLMDSSETRRGLPCWYKNDEVGLGAVNDGLLLEAGFYAILRKHFHNKPYYVNLLDTFHEASLKTHLGQCLDKRTAQTVQSKLELFNMDRYNSIVRYKTAYYSFHLPVALAMHMVGNNDPEMHRQAKTILLEMGHFFQVQNDFLNCFGDPAVTGKVGTDIQEGKCTWLAVVALQRVSLKQREIMEKYYGSSDPDHVRIIKDLYEDLGLPHMYAIYEEKCFSLIQTHIHQISRGLPHNLFFKLLEKIFRREC